MPLVSIIVPCFKVEKYLDRCIHSLINQTLNDIEILLIDDCSPDKVPQICDNWAKYDPRIKVIHKEKNEGLGLARNTGLELATGKYIAFVDSDDYVTTDMYEKLYSTAIKNSSDIVYCGIKQEIQKDKFIIIRDFDSERVFVKKDLKDLSINYFAPIQGEKLIMSVWHSIYKKETIGDLRFYSERIICSEDLPFQIAIILKANKITYIPDTLYYYCQNETSLSRSFNFNKCFHYIELSKLLISIYSYHEQNHIWSFYLKTCKNFIRTLIRSKLDYSEKINYLKQLCNRSDVSTELQIHVQKKQIGKMDYLYLYNLIHNHAFLLYCTALFDVKVICDKLGTNILIQHLYNHKSK